MKHENCRHLLDQLSGYLDEEASSRLCKEIQKDMAGCDRCRIVVDTLSKTITLYHHLQHPSVPEEARERLYKVLNLEDYL